MKQNTLEHFLYVMAGDIMPLNELKVLVKKYNNLKRLVEVDHNTFLEQMVNSWVGNEQVVQANVVVENKQPNLTEEVLSLKNAFTQFPQRDIREDETPFNRDGLKDVVETAELNAGNLMSALDVSPYYSGDNQYNKAILNFHSGTSAVVRRSVEKKTNVETENTQETHAVDNDNISQTIQLQDNLSDEEKESLNEFEDLKNKFKGLNINYDIKDSLPDIADIKVNRNTSTKKKTTKTKKNKKNK